MLQEILARLTMLAFGIPILWFLGPQVYEIIFAEEICRKGRSGFKHCINWDENFGSMMHELITLGSLTFFFGLMFVIGAFLPNAFSPNEKTTKQNND